MSDAGQGLDPRTEYRVCPNCENNVLDGQGRFTRENTYKSLASPGEVTHLEQWYQMQCTDCEEVFAIRERHIIENTDPDGDRDD